jgi:hypothetical protein
VITRPPLRRTRRKPKSQRRFKTPRCIVRGCVRAQMVGEMCRSHAKRAADLAWSLEVRRVGKCELAPYHSEKFPCGGVIQACHGISRRYVATRHLPLNGFAMCAAGHRYFGTHPLEWEEVLKAEWGELVYEEMRRLALGSWRMNGQATESVSEAR